MLGQMVCASTQFRDAMGKLASRGHLLALVNDSTVSNRVGIYEMDLKRAERELRHANGDPAADLAGPDGRAILNRLIANAAVEQAARGESISKRAVERETDLIQFQFYTYPAWLKALRASHLSRWSVACDITRNVRAQNWIEQQIATALNVSDKECAEYYTAHREEYSLPVRYRANHLFLAAPTGTPAPIIDEKCTAIEELSDRISHGESFTELVTQTSEDEATKTRGGDLGYFAADRMLPDFVTAVAAMRIGEISAPIQTPLGLHIIQLIDVKPARQMTFEELRDEIRLRLENEKRLAAVQKLAAELARKAELMTASF